MTNPDATARVRAYEADKERINDLRQGDDTQADVIRRLLDEGGLDVDDLKAVSSTPEDLTQLRNELLKRLDRIEDAATTAEERTGNIERTLETEVGGR